MPTYTDTTEQLYALLPGHHRQTDDEQPGPLDQPLKRYLSAIGDELDDLVALIDRIAYVGSDGSPASDLADPDLADTAWMRWLAQTVGIDPDSGPGPELQLAIQTRSFDAGSLRSLKATVAALLADPKRYLIVKHADGDPWTIRIFAHPDDAGGRTWDTYDLDFATWNELESTVPTWDDLEDVAPIADRAALAAVKPAGVLFDVQLTTDSWDLLASSVATWDEYEAAYATWDDLEGDLFS